jgi:hypothetical protein
MHPIGVYILIFTGALLQDIEFTRPSAALFFNRDPNKLIMSCKDDIFIVNVSTRHLQPFSCTPKGAYYYPHALALSDDDSVLAAGSYWNPNTASGYDTASLTRLWISDAASDVCAVCLFDVCLLVTVYGKPTLVLDLKSGSLSAPLTKMDGASFAIGVIEGCFSLYLDLISPQTSTP